MAHPPLRPSSRTIRTRLRAAAGVAVLACALLAGLLAPGPAFAVKTLSLSTGTIQLSLPAGGSGGGSITVANTGTEIIDALVYVADARIDAKGMPVYERPKAGVRLEPRSPATWVGLQMPPGARDIAGTPAIHLKAGDQTIVSFTETVPPNARPGDHNAVVFFEMFEPDPASPTGAVSKVTGRIGARIVTKVQGQIRDSLLVTGLKIPGFVIGDSAPYSFTVVNDGNVDKRYTATLGLASAPPSMVATSGVAYAGDKTAYSGVVSLKGAAIGPATVVLLVEHRLVSRDGSATPAAKVIRQEQQLFVVPWWLAVLIAAIVAVAVLWLLWFFTMRSRRRRVATMHVAAPKAPPSHRTRAADPDLPPPSERELPAEAPAPAPRTRPPEPPSA
jgi:hypothetical protein